MSWYSSSVTGAFSASVINQSNNSDRLSVENRGKTVAIALQTQRYFEFTLGWDFENVWEWDEANNRPVLRNLATAASPKSTTNTTGMEDLLLQQIRNNVWL